MPVGDWQQSLTTPVKHAIDVWQHATSIERRSAKPNNEYANNNSQRLLRPDKSGTLKANAPIIYLFIDACLSRNASWDCLRAIFCYYTWTRFTGRYLRYVFSNVISRVRSNMTCLYLTKQTVGCCLTDVQCQWKQPTIHHETNTRYSHCTTTTLMSCEPLCSTLSSLTSH